jgi:hypothetical protein
MNISFAQEAEVFQTNGANRHPAGSRTSGASKRKDAVLGRLYAARTYFCRGTSRAVEMKSLGVFLKQPDTHKQ